MQQPLISVIVPIYKVEDYLDKCVESILAQTYKNLEVWLVDDGTPDKCGEMCDEWAKKDSRIKVIHKPNGGVSDARNVALDAMTGEYVACIDGDDTVSQDYIDCMYNLVVKYDCEIAMCSFVFDYEGKVRKYHKEPYKEFIYDSTEATRSLFYQKNFDNYPWCKLYHRSLFDDVRYPKGIIYEDLCVTYKLFMKCKKIAYCNKQSLNYLIRNDSYEGASFNSLKMDSALKTLRNLEGDESLIDGFISNAYKCRLFCFACHLILKAPSDYHDIYILWDVIKKYRATVLKDRHSRIQAKIAAVLSFFGLTIMKIAFKLVDKRK